MRAESKLQIPLEATISLFKKIILDFDSYKFCVSYIKGGMQAKGIWKQDPEANIWAQEGWEWGMEKAPQWGTS